MRTEIIGDINHLLLLMVQDIKINTKALIHPVHTMVALHVSLEGSKVTGGIIILVRITTGTLFTLSRILKDLFQLE
jgi:hypothetical protein